jgi:hypothetical protein
MISDFYLNVKSYCIAIETEEILYTYIALYHICRVK